MRIAPLEGVHEGGDPQARPSLTDVLKAEALEGDAVGHPLEGEGLHDQLRQPHVAQVGAPGDAINGLDDMALGDDGMLYIAANGMGRVWRVNPATGDACIIASGLQNLSREVRPWT